MRSLAARPGWEEQMFPNWHLCCPGVSSSDSVPLPPLALAGGVPAAGIAASKDITALAAPVPMPRLELLFSSPWWPRGEVTVPLLAVPAGEPATIGAALAAGPEGNAIFALFHLFGKGVGCGGSPIAPHPGAATAQLLTPSTSPWLSVLVKSLGLVLSVSPSRQERGAAASLSWPPAIP